MTPARQLQVHGSVSAQDTAGRSIEVQCEDFRVNLDASSTTAALAALTALRRALASAGSTFSPAATALAIGPLGHFQVDLRVRGRIIGFAGRGAHPNWLGRRLTQMPVEVRWSALMRALFARHS